MVERYHLEKAEAITRSVLRRRGFENLFDRLGSRRRTIRRSAQWLASGCVTERMLRWYLAQQLPDLDAVQYGRLLRKKLTRAEANKLSQVKRIIRTTIRFLWNEYGIIIDLTWEEFIEKVKLLSNEEARPVIGVGHIGCYDPIFDSVFLVNTLSGNSVIIYLLHEWLHYAAVGFFSTYLDEATTEFLTRQTLKSRGRDVVRAFDRYTYKCRQEGRKRIIHLTKWDEEMRRALVLAYFSGDLRNSPIVPLEQAHFVLHGNTQVQLNNGKPELMRFSETLSEIRSRAGAITGETLLVKFDHSTSPITISRATARKPPDNHRGFCYDRIEINYEHL